MEITIVIKNLFFLNFTTNEHNEGLVRTNTISPDFKNVMFFHTEFYRIYKIGNEMENKDSWRMI